VATFFRIKSGNWRAQIRRAGHAKLSKVFDTKAEAREWAEQLEGDRDKLDAYPNAEARRRTVKDAVDGYMLDFAGRDTGMSSRLSWWRTEYGSTTLANFRQPQIREGLRKLARENVRRGNGRGKSKGKTETVDRKKTSSTITRYQSSISSVMRWAVDQGWLTRNPVIGIRRPKATPGRTRFLSDDERTALLDASDASEWEHLGLLARLALSTGARLGELMALEWERIDIKGKAARIATSKNDQPRTLPLVPAVVERLEKMVRPIKGGLLFPSPRDSDKPYEMRKPWNAAVKAAGLVDFRFHDLRHSCASFLAASGASIIEIADVLGHRQLAMAYRYSHLNASHKAALVTRVLSEKVR
jgi:integrase